MLFLSRAASLAVMSLAMIGLTSLSSPSRASLNPTAASPTITVAQGQLPEPPQNVPLLQPVPAITPIEPVSPAPRLAPDAAKPSYATLDAAVTAQAMPDTASDELRCLAVTIYHEAKGEPLAGQLAVANVVINRTTSGRFPKTICSVVMQPGQFSFIHGGRMPEMDASRAAYRTALAVAQVALNAAWRSPAPTALYFHARSRNANWGRTQVASIGNHIFYR